VLLLDTQLRIWTHTKPQVLTDYVTREDLTEDQAIEIVQRAYFHNSNELYRLGLSRPET